MSEKVAEPVSEPATVRMDPWSFVSVGWMTPVIKIGAKRDLDSADLPRLKDSDTAPVTPNWADATDATKASLFSRFLNVARWQWLISGLLVLVSIASMLGIPLVLQQVIDLAGAKSAVESIPNLPSNAWDLATLDLINENIVGYKLMSKSPVALAFLLLGLKLVSTITGRMHDMITKRVSFNARTVLMSAIVKKSLTISPSTANTFSKGYVLNLINVDAEGVALAMDAVHQLWTIPVQLIAIVALLASMLGSSLGAGIGAMFASLSVLGVTIPLLIVGSVPRLVVENDSRVKLIREVLDGIRLIKIRCIGDEFSALISGARARQLLWLKRFLYGVVCFVVIGQLSSSLMPVATFTLYAVRGNALNPGLIFPALSLFNMLVNPLIQLPQVVSSLVTAMISWNRIAAYLAAPDRDKAAAENSADIAIRIDAATFNYPASTTADKQKIEAKGKKQRRGRANKKEEVAEITPVEVVAPPRNVLSNVNLAIPKGTFIAVVGQVGSGKSSLLAAILGGLERSSGTVSTNGSISYCTQQPWIQTGSVEDNILFGATLDQQKLEKAVTCTSLQSDLNNMPSGIKTILGEKGTSVSGGQKTRIALARAVFNDADIYLLDDPLSSLDAHVGRAVFVECFKTALKGKTIVLATHNHDVLKETDSIIFLNQNGELVQGTHEELMRIPEFANFVVNVDDAKSTSAVVKKDAKLVLASENAEATDLGIIALEGSETGNVKWATYMSYISAAGGNSVVFLLFVAVILLEAGGILNSMWLTWWTDGKLLGESRETSFWTLWFNIIAWLSILSLIILNLIIHAAIMRSTRVFHQQAIQGVLNAPMWWFESQQIGRIMNRFTKDMSAIDQRLLPQVFQLIAGFGGLLSVLVILAITAPYLLIGVLPLAALYMHVLRYYRATMRQLKRLESVQRSPLYSLVSEALEGVPTILAYNRTAHFAQITNKLLDFSNSPLFFKFGAELWIVLRLELLSAVLIFALALLSTNGNVISAQNLGLGLLYTNSLTTLMNMILQSAANMETEMVSVERLVEYAERLPIEGQYILPSDPKPDAWPSSGLIELKEVSASYRSKPDVSVLKEVVLTINSGEKVCVVGRTGSGKSTLLGVLLRFVDMKGEVKIDGIDITSVGLQTLRTAMEVIPQDIYLFSGTIRSNLDRSGLLPDNELWSALDSVGMHKFVTNLEKKLDTPVENGGTNFSLGQRQLLYFARILLVHPKILLMDEATSSVDPESESALRQVLQQQFAGVTVLAVLHRLQASVLDDFDKVLVMDAGRVAEFDSPRALLEREGSIFASLYNAHSSG
ncbi:hypothetical protein CcCBS67573_g01814 [Chytriomyces confervae]|uniref:P-loop containing nucleoside triphosphate hydrolase protein n=1 Tax=Chytriomyces confervae TaxID=246404 RepID=A0A507FKZ6_9FUNG|nr:ATP-binding cassette sub- C member 8 [Chytriomyces hyalinus]TPX76912.1 hypothetical protein CcCBS67573_g01814 [Chytriomyces confervae]